MIADIRSVDFGAAIMTFAAPDLCSPERPEAGARSLGSEPVPRAARGLIPIVVAGVASPGPDPRPGAPPDPRAPAPDPGPPTALRAVLTRILLYPGRLLVKDAPTASPRSIAGAASAQGPDGEMPRPAGWGGPRCCV